MTKGFENKANFDIIMDADDLIKTFRKSLLLRLGWPEHEAEERILSEIKMTRETNFVRGLENRYDIKNKLILDAGCGIGGFVVQLGLNGARVIGAEPSREYSIITQKRIAKYGLKDKCQCMTAPGEFLPLSDNTFDYVICFSVLEHTNTPSSVVKEMVRATKPNGIILIQTENYLSFWDAHYRILWFPLMPKKLANVSDLNRINLEGKFRNPKSIHSPLKRFVVNTFKFVRLNKTPFLQLILLIGFLRNIMKPGIVFDLKKVNDKDGEISESDSMCSQK